MLGAQIDGDFRGRDADNITGDGVSVIYRSDGIFQQLIKRLFGVGFGGILRSGLGFNVCGLFGRGRSDFLCRGLFYLDLVAHFFTTSLMIQDGTEAPAVIPIRPSPGNRDVSSSDASATKKNARTFFAAKLCQMQAVRAVRTADDDHCVAYPGKRGCFSAFLDVAPHIVSNILKFVHLF